MTNSPSLDFNAINIASLRIYCIQLFFVSFELDSHPIDLSSQLRYFQSLFANTRSFLFLIFLPLV
jgi:hypothetical protein